MVEPQSVGLQIHIWLHASGPELSTLTETRIKNKLVVLTLLSAARVRLEIVRRAILERRIFHVRRGLLSAVVSSFVTLESRPKVGFWHLR